MEPIGWLPPKNPAVTSKQCWWRFNNWLCVGIGWIGIEIELRVRYYRAKSKVNTTAKAPGSRTNADKKKLSSKVQMQIKQDVNIWKNFKHHCARCGRKTTKCYSWWWVPLYTLSRRGWAMYIRLLLDLLLRYYGAIKENCYYFWEEHSRGKKRWSSQSSFW